MHAARLSPLLTLAALCLTVNCHALQLSSQHAIVVSNQTGAVLLEKGAQDQVPIASLTKLMTAMTVLDSHPDLNEMIAIEDTDVDQLKHSRSHVPVGARMPRREVLQLALMSSDNRAAAALARTYPGGQAAFVKAVDSKLQALGMTHTVIKEPTGLSPDNTSTAADLAKMALAASRYPQIANITTDPSAMVRMKQRPVLFHNTNRLVGTKGWDILLSKTGFTNEAGHCLIMRIKQAGKDATLVLLNAGATQATRRDAASIRNFLTKLVKTPAVMTASTERGLH